MTRFRAVMAAKGARSFTLYWARMNGLAGIASGALRPRMTTANGLRD